MTSGPRVAHSVPHVFMIAGSVLIRWLGLHHAGRLGNRMVPNPGTGSRSPIAKSPRASSAYFHAAHICVLTDASKRAHVETLLNSKETRRNDMHFDWNAQRG